MNAPLSPQEWRRGAIEIASMQEEMEIRRERKRQRQRGWYDDDGILQGGLMAFIRYFWSILEPETPLQEGWAFYAIIEHLEAVSFGEITRLLINVSPGFAKSITTDVFFPAWEWTALGRPHTRYLAVSYSADLTERDNDRCVNLINDPKFQRMYPLRMTKTGVQLIGNNKTGWKKASSVGGAVTGLRADRVLLDDPHNVIDIESEIVRSETVRWFRESLSNRLNSPDSSAIIIIMQRLHEMDVSGILLERSEE